jgi:hypothetical protein
VGDNVVCGPLSSQEPDDIYMTTPVALRSLCSLRSVIMATPDIIFYTAKVRTIFLLPLYPKLTFVQICPYSQRVGPVSLLPRVEVLTKVATTGGNRLPRGESGRDQVLD